MAFSLTMGYQHMDLSQVGGDCPCNDPGNFVMVDIDEMEMTIRCWCGGFKNYTFDSEAERTQFISTNGG